MDPMTDIENEKAQRDVGATGYRVYTGAREDGASRLDAFMVLVAWFRGMIGSANDANPRQDDEKEANGDE